MSEASIVRAIARVAVGDTEDAMNSMSGWHDTRPRYRYKMWCDVLAMLGQPSSQVPWRSSFIEACYEEYDRLRRDPKTGRFRSA